MNIISNNKTIIILLIVIIFLNLYVSKNLNNFKENMTNNDILENCLNKKLENLYDNITNLVTDTFNNEISSEIIVDDYSNKLLIIKDSESNFTDNFQLIKETIDAEFTNKIYTEISCNDLDMDLMTLYDNLLDNKKFETKTNLYFIALIISLITLHKGLYLQQDLTIITGNNMSLSSTQTNIAGFQNQNQVQDQVQDQVPVQDDTLLNEEIKNIFRNTFGQIMFKTSSIYQEISNNQIPNEVTENNIKKTKLLALINYLKTNNKPTTNSSYLEILKNDINNIIVNNIYSTAGLFGQIKTKKVAEKWIYNILILRVSLSSILDHLSSSDNLKKIYTIDYTLDTTNDNQTFIHSTGETSTENIPVTSLEEIRSKVKYLAPAFASGIQEKIFNFLA